MTVAEQIQAIEIFIGEVLADMPEYFLVSVKIKPTNNIRVYLDGDAGLTIEKCVFLNRKLYKFVEESALYAEGDFSLEVSSPGITEPLKLPRQYQKNVGRMVEVVLADDTEKQGTLLTVTDADIVIECTEGKGKKAVIQQLVIPLNNIKSTTVQIKF